jgi:hypothetical protein
MNRITVHVKWDHLNLVYQITSHASFGFLCLQNCDSDRKDFSTLLEYSLCLLLYPNASMSVCMYCSSLITLQAI